MVIKEVKKVSAEYLTKKAKEVKVFKSNIRKAYVRPGCELNQQKNCKNTVIKKVINLEDFAVTEKDNTK